MTQSNAYFEQESLWGRPPEPYQVRVREDLLAMIGPDVKSILDVGCGDGYITNALPEGLEVVALDSSAAALAHVNRRTVQGSATRLPFEDASFDLVMANDLLEHLGDADLRQALAEIRRVSRRYIVITSPFMENLASGMTGCGACGEAYHVNHHLRAFGSREFETMFDGLPPCTLVFTGAAVDPVDTAQRLLRASLGLPAQWDLAVCPTCGQRASLGVPAQLRALVDEAGAALAPWVQAFLPDRSECIAAYSKDGSASAVLPKMGPGLSLVVRAGASPRAASGKVVSDGPHTVFEPTTPCEGKPAYLAMTVGTTAFLYSTPQAMDGRRVVVPAWFNAPRLKGMSAGSGGRGMATADYMLLAMRGNAGQLATRQVELQNALAQNEELRLRQGGMDRIEVDCQNLRAENGQLRARLGQAEQMAVELQNARAESNQLKTQVGGLEQLTIELQNARAESDQLKSRLGQAEQLAIELQNARAESDQLKSRLGQAEQLAIELQNARAENDQLKLRLGQCEQLAVDLQNARAELESMKRTARCDT